LSCLESQQGSSMPEFSTQRSSHLQIPRECGSIRGSIGKIQAWSAVEIFANPNPGTLQRGSTGSGFTFPTGGSGIGRRSALRFAAQGGYRGERPAVETAERSVGRFRLGQCQEGHGSRCRPAGGAQNIDPQGHGGLVYLERCERAAGNPAAAGGQRGPAPGTNADDDNCPGCHLPGRIAGQDGAGGGK